ncbi:MAG: hypothetical protein JNK74_19335 [Candidatus Hydrogenedentes bacterium]|nr:hypothetical protein [Candidatus Hydrogenedentota bacterium]
MFEIAFDRKIEARCEAHFNAVLERRAEGASEGCSLGLSVTDMWEKCEDVARRVAILSDMEQRFPLAGEYDNDLEYETDLRPWTFSNLLLAISHVLVFQPDRASDHLGLFASTIEIERLLFHDRLDSVSVAGRWPSDLRRQYIRIRNYRLESDPLGRLTVLPLSEFDAHEDDLYRSFRDNYILLDDLDEEYELYIRQFCRLTLELAGYCAGFCEAMAAWVGDERVGDMDTESELQVIARITLYARSIAAFGLRFGYASWLETLDSRY